MGKSNNTRFHNKFVWWSVADCDCKWCRYYGGKKSGCTLETCCCTEERAEAYRLESEKKKASVKRKRKIEAERNAGRYA